MRTRTLAVALLATVSYVAAADAAPSSSPHRGHPATCDGRPVTSHLHEARTLLRAAYDLDRWEEGPKRRLIRTAQEHARCIEVERTRRQLSGFRRELAEALATHAKTMKITPYPGGGTYWAIPWSIVACESGGSWSAANPSGAIGPYQLLGHGAPFPVTSEADKLAHHRIASALWAGGAGRSHWVC